MGMPPPTAETTLPTPADKQTRDGVTLDAREPKYSVARSLVATTALPKVRGSCGTTNRKNAVVMAPQAGRSSAGSRTEMDPPGDPVATTVANTPAATRTRDAPYRRRGAAHTTPPNAAAARRRSQGWDGVPRKTPGGSRTSFHAVTNRSAPTPTCKARTTGCVNRRAATSANRRTESASRNRPISSPAAWITSGATPWATATADSAFRG
jgi:hypothetical protein